MYADPTITPEGPRSLHFRGKRPIPRLPKLAHPAAPGRWRGRSPRPKKAEAARTMVAIARLLPREVLEEEVDRAALKKPAKRTSTTGRTIVFSDPD